MPKKVHQKILNKHIIEICVLNKVLNHKDIARQTFLIIVVFFNRFITLNHCPLELSAKDCL